MSELGAQPGLSENAGELCAQVLAVLDDQNLSALGKLTPAT
jgi:hypothetical protein